MLQIKIFKWILISLLICLPVMATLSDYGITWDEPIYQEAAWNIQKWLSLESQKIFDQNEINRYWKTDPGRNVHPSGVKWFYLIAQKIIFWEKNPYRQNGILNVLIFSVSLIIFLKWWSGNLFYRNVLYILLILSIPRFFAHIHFPATDIPMTSFMLLFLVSLEKTILQKNFWLPGIILGIFFSIKITAFFLIFPVLLVLIIWHRYEWKKVLIRIILICLIGILMFYILNPDYWFSPWARSREFLAQSLTRRSWSPFTVYFGGHFYNYRGPFYYPFTMFFITTPLLHLLFLFSGITLFFAQKRLRADLKMILIFFCLVFPFLILALPVFPAHDGIRYLLPAFPFVTVFMTLGLERLWNFVRNHSHVGLMKSALQWITTTTALLLFAGDLHSPARFPPFELSYYNRIVGGISGAFKRGYETTYWWEIINDDVLDHLNNLCEGSSVYFPLPPTDLFFKHMTNYGKIDFNPVRNPNAADFMLIIGRPFVKYWDHHIWPQFMKQGKRPVPIWDISLDSVPLLRLYVIQKVD